MVLMATAGGQEMLLAFSVGESGWFFLLRRQKQTNHAGFIYVTLVAEINPLLLLSSFLPTRYVSRYHVKDSARHVILGTQQFKPNEFASQINLSIENAWGILRCVIDICMKLDEGKYLILKDPNKQVIRIYSLPDGTFSSDEDEEDEEEEEEEEGL